MSQNNLAKLRRTKLCRTWTSDRLPILCLMLVLSSVALAQQAKSAKTDVSGRYEGTAKNKAEDIITVTLDLTDKEGAVSGAIHSSHGDFAITGGTHQGDTVTIDFDAGGSSGTISLRLAEDKLVGTWTAGDDGGPVDVKKAAAQNEVPKGKS
jgi:hypothetical protein